MADPRNELRGVKEELEMVEQQIASLLDQQNRLIQKRSDLELIIRDVATKAKADNAKDWQKSDFPWSRKLVELRSSIFHLQEFRPLQLQTMNATLSGKDCVLIMPTGGGKSLCFQLPAVASKGITLVVSPLVSLMEDQVMALEKLRVSAVMLNASSSKEHIKYVQDNMTNARCPFRLLYVTPEKLAKSKRFMARLEKMFEAGLFSRLVIDEVHCCSQWGHDFRPDYKFLGVMRRQFPGVPILGLTATATNSVLHDVKKILGIHDCLVFRASFNRHNLFYEVRIKPSGLKATIDEIHKLINSRFRGQSGIVYCLTQKDTEEVAKELQGYGIQAGCYHANLDPQYRSKIHTRWIKDEIKVVVATIAFGMGIDKPDVRFVVHHSISKSMENYYQESGRAGRDDQQSHCILYVGFSDVARQSTMVFTEQTGLEKLYNMVDYAFNIGRCRRTLIARHFGERWDSSQCNKMCDHCNKPLGAAGCSSQDVTSLCRDVIAILENAKRKEQRITALKLLDSVMGRGASILRVKTLAPPKLSQRNVERVLMSMLLTGYLREDFHFTAYTTLSYLLPGPKSTFLMDQDHVVFMDLEDVKPGGKSGKKTSSARVQSPKITSADPGAGSSGSKGESGSRRISRKPVVVNVENSHFISGGIGISPDGQKATQKENSKRKLSTKKGRSVVIGDDDDDDDNLDFGDVGDIPSKKKLKTQLVTKRNRGCILIEDSDDEDFVKSTKQDGSKKDGRTKNKPGKVAAVSSLSTKETSAKSGKPRENNPDVSPSSGCSDVNGQSSAGGSSEDDIHSAYARQLDSVHGNRSPSHSDRSDGKRNHSNSVLDGNVSSHSDLDGLEDSEDDTMERYRKHMEQMTD